MNLGLLGFRAHGLYRCNVTHLAEHVERTGMWVMDSRKEASKLGLSRGGSVEVSGPWERRHREQGAQHGVPVAEMGSQKRICFRGRFA